MKEEDGESVIAAMCPQCHENYPGLGYYHNDGFFHNWEIVCEICKTVIHKGVSNGTQEED
jgi:hypothetical protein